MATKKTQEQPVLFENMEQYLNTLTEKTAASMRDAIGGIRKFTAAAVKLPLQVTERDVTKWIMSLLKGASINATITLALDLGRVTDLMSFIDREIRRYKKKNKIETLTFTDLVKGDDDPDGIQIVDGERIVFNSSLLTKILAKAIEREKAANIPIRALSRPPERYIQTNSVLSAALGQQGLLNTPEFNLPIFNIGKESQIDLHVVFERNFDTVGGRVLTPYEQCVLNAATSLIVAGNTCFTMEMLYRALGHTPESGHIPTDVKDELRRIMDKITDTKVMLDYTDEAVKKGFTDDEGKPLTISDTRRRTTLINADWGTMTVNGTVVEGYILNQKPLVYEHDNRINQIINSNIELIKICEVAKNGKPDPFKPVRITPQRQIIVDYLIRRVGIMKRARKNSNGKIEPIIVLETLYKECEVNTDNRQYLAETRAFLFQVLDYWKAKRHIAGYEIEKKGNKIRSVKILFGNPRRLKKADPQAADQPNLFEGGENTTPTE